MYIVNSIFVKLYDFRPIDLKTIIFRLISNLIIRRGIVWGNSGKVSADRNLRTFSLIGIISELLDEGRKKRRSLIFLFSKFSLPLWTHVRREGVPVVSRGLTVVIRESWGRPYRGIGIGRGPCGSNWDAGDGGPRRSDWETGRGSSSYGGKGRGWPCHGRKLLGRLIVDITRGRVWW